VNRTPLPTQPHAIEHPVTPVGASATGGSPWNAIDGYNDVFSSTSVGQTLWSGGAPAQSVTVDLGVKYYNLEILGYLPRQDYTGANRNLTGDITGYTISVSDNDTAFQQVASGTWPADSTYKIAEWAPAAAGRYVRLTATSANGNTSVVINEIAVGGRVNTPSTTPSNVVFKRESWPLSPKCGPGIIVNINGLNPVYNSAASPAYVYDLAGRIIKRVVINGSFPYIRRDFGMAQGVYIFKTAGQTNFK
jgi:hypothetical protein